MNIERLCENSDCSVRFTAKSADVKRGWGRFCSKRCKAVQQGRARHHQVVVSRAPARKAPIFSIEAVTGCFSGPEFQFSE